MTEPNNDSVRVALPTRPETPAASPNEAKPGAAGVLLPSHGAAAMIRRLPPKITPSALIDPASPIPRRPPVITPTLQPSPKPFERLKEAGEIAAAPSVHRGPKQETARITPVAPMVPRSRSVAAPETIPRPLCWGLAGLSTAIFLIQIWNYVVS